MPTVEKAIRESGLNLNPVADGAILKVPLPKYVSRVAVAVAVAVTV